MEFRILGPLETYEAGKQVPVGGAKQKALLAMLLLNGNQVVRARLYPVPVPHRRGRGKAGRRRRCPQLGASEFSRLIRSLAGSPRE
jgi:hypothetical protein